MSPRKPSKRAYNSSRRQAQARETRRQIVEAARRLFLERGYSGATIEAIAQEAGVAPETVYASFGSKRSLLGALIHVSVVGDDEPAPILEREGPAAVRKMTGQRLQVEGFAADMTAIMGRMAPIFEIMRSAAKNEPEIAAMLKQTLDGRLEGMRAFVGYLTANGGLNSDLPAGHAAETVWAISSGEVYTLLVRDRGWSPAQYQEWLAAVLTRLLLP